jgi:hypothetical protein
MRLLYDWFVLKPATAVDYVFLCLFGLAALVPPILAWHCIVKMMDENGIDWKGFPARPGRLTTWIVAITVSAYVAVVCVVAVSEIPYVFYEIAGPNDPD